MSLSFSRILSGFQYTDNKIFILLELEISYNSACELGSFDIDLAYVNKCCV